MGTCPNLLQLHGSRSANGSADDTLLPASIDDGFFAPSPCTPARGSPARWLQHSQRSQSCIVSGTEQKDSGLEALSDLENALTSAVKRQAVLARRWYCWRETPTVVGRQASDM